MKYRRKSVPVDCVQFFDNKKCFRDLKSQGIPIKYDYQNVPHCFMYVRSGSRVSIEHLVDKDWIIKELGSYSICDPDIFEDEYKPIIKRKRAKIVCICGSTRFCKEIAVYKWDLEKQGIMAIGLHLLPPDYFNVQPSHQAEFEGVKDILDVLHFRKIDIANEVFIFNKDGYIGEQTKIEITYARASGKKINYLEPIKGR